MLAPLHRHYIIQFISQTCGRAGTTDFSTYNNCCNFGNNIKIKKSYHSICLAPSFYGHFLVSYSEYFFPQVGNPSHTISMLCLYFFVHLYSLNCSDSFKKVKANCKKDDKTITKVYWVYCGPIFRSSSCLQKLYSLFGKLI